MKCKQNTTNNLNWTAVHQQLLKHAQAGNQAASNMLFNQLTVFLKVIHSHSQDGQYPSIFGHAFNYNGRTFEEASSDIHGVFSKCVKSYDSSYRVPFGAYLVNELKLRAKDWVRNRKNDRLVRVGHAVGESGDVILDEAGYEKACCDYYASVTGDSHDAEVRPMEHAEDIELFNMIFETVKQNGDEKLIKFLDEYYEYGLEKNGMEVVAEHMDVTRTATYNYLKQVRNLLRPKFGEFFADAA